MKIYKEISLSEFEFWSGAKQLASLLTEKEMEEIELWIDDYQLETGTELTETDINDFFWFGDDKIAEILGYCCEDCLWNHLLTRNKT